MQNAFTTYDSLKDILQKSFSCLDESAKQSIYRESKVLHFNSGEVIYTKNEANGGLLLLLEGILSIELPSKSIQHITHFVQAGEVYYAHESFLGIPNQSSCSALLESNVLQIPTGCLKNFSLHYPSLLLEVLTWTCKEQAIFEQHAANLLGLSVRHRFINALKSLREKFIDKNNYIPIQPDVIGNFILASKSSLFRTLSELEKEKIIQSDKNGIRILQNNLLDIN